MSDPLRIALIGQAAFGESVLNALIEKSEEVVAVFCPPAREGRPEDALESAADRHGVPVYQFKRMRDGEAIEAYRALDADLGVMAFVTDIVPEEILEAPTRGTIQYHPSLLPKHRGPSSINWPIIQGESETGLSIFWPDAGLDTGPILLQKGVEITPDDTLGTLYFNKLFSLGVEAMVESVEMVRNGTAPRLEQDESQATYQGWCKAEHCVVDWGKPIGDTYNLIRGADPSPGAGTTHSGDTLQLYNASKSDEDTGADAGVVVEVAEAGLRVAAPGGSLLIGRVKPQGGGKVAAQEWAASAGVSAGDRLGT